MISGIFLSGVKVIAFHGQDYIPEHAVPALEGGITERIGRQSDSVEIHGFLYSGSDIDKTTLLSMIGFMRHLDVPSTNINDPLTFRDYYTLRGDMVIKKIDFIQPAGKQYPYYEYIIHGVFPSSGEVFFIISGTSGRATGGGGGGSAFTPVSGMNSLLIDYSQVLPIFVSIHPDYSQVLPIAISIHPDYSQVLPLGVGIHANYVRIS